MIIIDGSRGEGGGQVLRTSLALSLVTGLPFHIDRIRAARKKPGLMPQHLSAVNAAAVVGNAQVEGATLRSSTLTFIPHPVKAGKYNFAVGTAGSCTLILETVLPALLLADSPSKVALEGGTHNPLAPPYDFLAHAFLPLVERMGPKITIQLHRHGFYPAGGGSFSVSIVPTGKLARLDLPERGKILSVAARATVAKIPASIAERELKVVQDRLGWHEMACSVEEATSSIGPGNTVCIEINSENVTEVFTGFGQRGVPAETVAAKTVDEVEAYLAAGVPVGRYLADQLILPLALAVGGSFRTLAPSAHLITNAEVIGAFLPVEVTMRECAPDDWEVRVERTG